MGTAPKEGPLNLEIASIPYLKVQVSKHVHILLSVHMYIRTWIGLRETLLLIEVSLSVQTYTCTSST